MADLPENVTLEWLGRHLLAIGEDVRSLRSDVDKLTVIVRQMRDELDVQGAMVLRIDRRLERLETERRVP